jgi:hypothetical protein
MKSALEILTNSNNLLSGLSAIISISSFGSWVSENALNVATKNSAFVLNLQILKIFRVLEPLNTPQVRHLKYRQLRYHQYNVQQLNRDSFFGLERK